jgi:hypothetical protein
MKQFIIVCILLGAAWFCSCQSAGETPQKAVGPVRADMAVPLGWIDSGTFRAMAVGSGRDGALNNAQLVVIEKFITERIKLSGMNVDPKSTGVAIVNEFGSDVKNGSIIAEKPEEGGKVRIIYEVKADNLKNRVLGRKY